MKNFLRTFLKGYDFFLLGSAVLLCAIGLAVLFSTTYDLQLSSEAARQAFYIPLGLVGLIVLSRFDYRMFKTYTGIPTNIPDLTIALNLCSSS